MVYYKAKGQPFQQAADLCLTFIDLYDPLIGVINLALCSVLTLHLHGFLESQKSNTFEMDHNSVIASSTKMPE